MSLNFDYEFLLRIGMAILIGGIIGAEREYKNKSAGFRTMIIICVASMLFTMLSITIGGIGNPDRIASNILTGLGFLGAGVIWREEMRISGITTATTIWVTAAIGMAIGSNHYFWAISTTVCIMLVLLAFTFFQRFIDNLHQIRSYRIVISYSILNLNGFEQIFKKYNLKPNRMKQCKVGEQLIGSWSVYGSKDNHEAFIAFILKDPSIQEFDF